MTESTPLMEIIGERIRERRESLCLSLEQLAARIDMSKTGLWQVEKARSVPSAVTLYRLALTLGVSVDWIMGLTNIRAREVAS